MLNWVLWDFLLCVCVCEYITTSLSEAFTQSCLFQFLIYKTAWNETKNTHYEVRHSSYDTIMFYLPDCPHRPACDWRCTASRSTGTRRHWSRCCHRNPHLPRCCREKRHEGTGEPLMNEWGEQSTTSALLDLLIVRVRGDVFFSQI